jgi:hypothetical protein
MMDIDLDHVRKHMDLLFISIRRALTETGVKEDVLYWRVVWSFNYQTNGRSSGCNELDKASARVVRVGDPFSFERHWWD